MRIFFYLLINFSLLFSQTTVENGKTLILELKGKENLTYKYLNKNYNTIKNPKNKHTQLAIVPVSYYQKKPIKIEHSKNKIKIDVKQAKYKIEKLNVKQNRVKPPKNTLKRIKKEKEEALKIYNTFNKKQYFTNSFINPINSKITSQYGNARIFNKMLKSFHSGTDFRAALNSNIKAVNNGIVVLSKNRYYAGNSIIIDHGKGIYTSYSHLNKNKVKVGDYIKKGQVIAKSGNTGRSTGPHLHLGLIINGFVVDYLDFKNKINKYYD